MFFSSTRTLKIDKRLFEKLTELAQREGYATVDELIVHVLDQAVSQTDDPLDAQRAEQQLRGLGYLE